MFALPFIGWVKNRVQTAPDGKAPRQREFPHLYGGYTQEELLRNARPFGEPAVIHIPVEDREDGKKRKCEPGSWTAHCRFVGMHDESWLMWDEQRQKVWKTRSARFLPWSANEPRRDHDYTFLDQFTAHGTNATWSELTSRDEELGDDCEEYVVPPECTGEPEQPEVGAITQANATDVDANHRRENTTTATQDNDAKPTDESEEDKSPVEHERPASGNNEQEDRASTRAPPAHTSVTGSEKAENESWTAFLREPHEGSRLNPEAEQYRPGEEWERKAEVAMAEMEAGLGALEQRPAAHSATRKITHNPESWREECEAALIEGRNPIVPLFGWDEQWHDPGLGQGSLGERLSKEGRTSRGVEFSFHTDDFSMAQFHQIYSHEKRGCERFDEEFRTRYDLCEKALRQARNRQFGEHKITNAETRKHAMTIALEETIEAKCDRWRNGTPTVSAMVIPAGFEQAFDKEVKVHVDRKVLRAPTKEELANGGKPVPTNALFMRKRDGSYKCRIYVRGDLVQVKANPFAPTPSQRAVKIFVSLCAAFGLKLASADVKAAFLLADIDYQLAHLPEILQKAFGLPRVAVADKAINGFAHCGRAYHDYKTQALEKKGFHAILDDDLHVRTSKRTDIPEEEQKEELELLLVYVDDNFIGSSDDPAQTANRLADKFPWGRVTRGTDEWNEYDFVGTDVIDAPEQIFLHQENYIKKKCEEFNVTRNANHPHYIPPKQQKTTEEHERDHEEEALSSRSEHGGDRDESEVQLDTTADGAAVTEEQDEGGATSHSKPKLAGTLLWGSCCTRPEIAKATGAVGSERCQERANRRATAVFRWLRGTADYGLSYQRIKEKVVSIEIEEHVDADLGSTSSDRDARSTSGSVEMLVYTTVSGKRTKHIIGWRSKRQTSISIATVESEAIAVSDGIRQAHGARDTITEFIRLAAPFVQLATTAPKVRIHNDNTAAVSVANSRAACSVRLRHMRLRVAFIQTEARRGSVHVEWISTSQNLADIMTKELPPASFRGKAMALLSRKPARPGCAGLWLP